MNMRKLSLLLFAVFAALNTFAQFGTFEKKADIEKFKDTRVLVVMFEDSAYNASVAYAMERYWTYSDFDFVADYDVQKFRKGNYAFLIFSKAKGAKIKAKLGSSEADFNGLALLNKYSKRATAENLLAYSLCSNVIDTNDWKSEMVRGVQLLNNYFNLAGQAARDKDISESVMMGDYPTDKKVLFDKKLLIEYKQLTLKGKEDPNEAYGGELDAEVERDEIQRAILKQDNSVIYFFYSKSESTCHKLFVSAEYSELLYYTSASPTKCNCELKDLQALKDMREEYVQNREKKSKKGGDD